MSNDSIGRCSYCGQYYCIECTNSGTDPYNFCCLECERDCKIESEPIKYIKEKRK